MDNDAKEDLVSLYQSVRIELERAKMAGRLESAHKAIAAYVEISTTPGLHRQGRQATDAGSSAPCFFGPEDTRNFVEHKCLATGTSLDNLRATIQQLEDSVNRGKTREEGNNPTK